jgi:large subunit ribosomal protein L25
MADNVDLQAREREERGKNAARRLRASGMVPAVLYGDGDGSSTPLAVPDRSWITPSTTSVTTPSTT